MQKGCSLRKKITLRIPKIDAGIGIFKIFNAGTLKHQLELISLLMLFRWQILRLPYIFPLKSHQIHFHLDNLSSHKLTSSLETTTQLLCIPPYITFFLEFSKIWRKKRKQFPFWHGCQRHPLVIIELLAALWKLWLNNRLANIDFPEDKN